MNAAEELSAGLGATAPACDALGVPRASLYRRRRPTVRRVLRLRRCSHRALALEDRQVILDVLRSPRFVDKSPAQVCATLLDESTFYCSERSMYRYLAADDEVRDRRNQLRHPVYKKPELLAEAPNQIWSWDITKLRGPVKWTYFYLYVILDIFSRYVVGWMIAHRERAALAKRLIAESCRKQQIQSAQLTIHADRGSSMTSKSVAFLLGDLGVTKSHSRPHVSNDNPYSEAQFKTMKYCPQFPDRFGGAEHAHSFGRDFFGYYNYEHKHAGIAMLTPATVHYGHAETVLKQRHETMLEAYCKHPERFVNGPPRLPSIPNQVWINPPAERPRENYQPQIVTPASASLQGAH